jgi:glycosyltransferase involved in cell wall biosynthesis
MKDGEQFMKISVIIPAYHPEEIQLQSAVSSVLTQEYQDLEILIIDDGNEPKYLPILQKTAETDERIRVLHVPHGGVSAARNAGIRSAEGEYIFFLDADDLLIPGCLKEAAEIAERENADLLIGGTSAVYDNRKSRVQRLPETEIIRINHKNRTWLKKIMLGEIEKITPEVFFNRGIAARLVKTEVAQRHLFDQTLAYGEDTLFNMDIFCSESRVVLVKQAWYSYVRNPDSATHRYNPDIFRKETESLNRLRSYVDLENPLELKGWCERIRFVLNEMFACWLNRPEWQVSRAEKKKIMRKIYTSFPYTDLCTPQAVRSADRKERIKYLLFRHKKLFQVWRVTYSLRRLAGKKNEW